ncbi:Peptidyl-prolyl cis-trans isomerase FKBP65 [Abeliophyllum distichum]|uniref:peptidylprolyl isomerase n=1 Tax=Abeliophyllum distichum TaxID=126358 RepID=A0ABD1Q0S0_9LAMI
MDDDFEFPGAGNDAAYDEMGMDGMDLPVGNQTLKVGEEREIGDNGLRKKLLKEGEGWENPSSRDEVEVHYVGSLLDGTQFDSSHDQGTSFKFKLGEGHVIKGWEESIKTMKKGEKALFTIPPELAYGESGSPPKIPPNATLQFEVELLAWISVKDICKDGGILKKELTEGEGWQTPKDLDEVFVKYEARLEDGTLVSKSNGVEFTVADGYFCPALSKAVKTMKKGEKVFLTVKPLYGFGQNGRSATGDDCDVPPNANLEVNMELVSWKTVSDITNDKKVLKKIVQEGDGYDRPSDGATVHLKLIGKLQNGTVFEKRGHNEEPPFEFKVDEDKVIEGLDRAVKTMKKGEVALVTIQSQYAFGPSESQQELAVVPGNSTIYYEVEMVSFVKEKESWEMSSQEKIEAAGKKKEEGNAWFKAGKYERASKRYEKAVSFIEYESSFNEEEKKQAEVLKVTCNLNIAACKLKLKDYKEAERLCTEVVEIDSKNVKALYRRAQAYIHLVDLDLAEIDIKRALEIDPDNRDVKLVYKFLKEKVKEYNRKDAQFYGNIIAKMSQLEQAKSVAAAAKHGKVKMAIDRLKNVILHRELGEKALQTKIKGWLLPLVMPGNCLRLPMLRRLRRQMGSMKPSIKEGEVDMEDTPEEDMVVETMVVDMGVETMVVDMAVETMGGGYGGGNHGGGNHGGGGGGGHCRYGCCGRSYYGGGCKCCTYAGEAVDAKPEAKPQN